MHAVIGNHERNWLAQREVRNHPTGGVDRFYALQWLAVFLADKDDAVKWRCVPKTNETDFGDWNGAWRNLVPRGASANESNERSKG